MNSDSGDVEWGSVKLNSADAVGIDAEVEPCLSEVGEACDPGHVRKASNWEAVLEVEGVGVQVHLVGTAHGTFNTRHFRVSSALFMSHWSSCVPPTMLS
jgi:hypothetical protein